MVVEQRLPPGSPRKLRRALEADLCRAHREYVCAPCSGCRGSLQDIRRHCDEAAKVGHYHGGLVALIVNAMTNVEPGFLGFDEP